MFKKLRTFEEEERAQERASRLSEVVGAPIRTHLNELKVKGLYKEYEAKRSILEHCNLTKKQD